MSISDVVRHFGSRGKGFSSPDNNTIKNVKAFHLLGALAWAGGSLALQALCYIQQHEQAPSALSWVTFCLNFVDTWVIMPGLVLCIITGLFYSCCTAIGFFKYAWITFKWVITLMAAGLGFFFMSPLSDTVLALLESHKMAWPYFFVRGFLFPDNWAQAITQLILILSMCLISVYRPLSWRAITQRLHFFSPFTEKTSSLPIQPRRISWFEEEAINAALKRRKAPDWPEIEDIVAKSRSLEVLTLEETTALLRVTDEEHTRYLLQSADEVKRKVYGERIVMSAPLHISNLCGSDCLYCSYRKSNTAIQRKHLSIDEVKEAAMKLARQGLSRVFLVTGQFPGADVKLLTEAIQALYTTEENGHAIRRVNVNVGPLEPNEYAILKEAEVGTILIYQDTYHAKSYHAVHPTGPKSDYEKRLMAPDEAHMAGIGDAGLGIVLGLGPWQYDILGLTMHANHLMDAYGTGCRSVSVHRLRPAPGCSFATPYPISDATYMRAIAITRLAIPYTSLIVTSKEPAGLWHQACLAGGSHLLTGSVSNPYETWQNGLEHIPFPLGENCHVDEIVLTLLEANLLPSFCTACPRVGRQGDKFTALAAVGALKERCDLNSFTTCMGYLLHVATEETRAVGLRAIATKLDAMPEKIRLKTKRALEHIQNGADESLI